MAPCALCHAVQHVCCAHTLPPSLSQRAHKRPSAGHHPQSKAQETVGQRAAAAGSFTNGRWRAARRAAASWWGSVGS
eukprot:136189-Chlamydomonas_euryale.AAC.3